MPLRDHFHPPLSRSHPLWAFHGAWAAAMARGLNAGVLPAGYYAVPFLDRDGPVEIDVAAVRESSLAIGATALWNPPEPEWAVAVEEYATLGPVHAFLPRTEQAHQIYGVIDRTGGAWDVEAGVGIGVTDGSDKLTIKLILSRDLNRKK